jgi:hypothetical protein
MNNEHLNVCIFEHFCERKGTYSRNACQKFYEKMKELSFSV